MRKVLSWAAVAAVVLVAWSARGEAQTKTTPSKKKTATTRSSRRGGKNAGKRSPQTTWRNRQLSPTPARYKEIQSALVSKGYLQPENAHGSWNQTSIDALKKFQREQNLESTGKINSLSLIALGLGPKRETAQPAKP